MVSQLIVLQKHQGFLS